MFPDFQDSSQIGLLKELLDLQKDMVVMLLSLLEGRVSVSVRDSPHPFFPPISACNSSSLASICFQATW